MCRVSVVIPAYNAEQTLSKLLCALACQTLRDGYEVIVVNNGSTDDTHKILCGIIENYPVPLKIVQQPQGVSIATVRNLGVSLARGNILAFIDSDCEPPLDWLQSGVELVESYSSPVLLSGSCQPPPNGTWVEKAWHSTRSGHKLGTCFVHGANFFISKNLFQEVGGFREHIETSEDYDLGRRVSYNNKVVPAPNLLVVHYGEANTLYKKIKKEMWYSKSMFDTLMFDHYYKPFWISLFFLIVFSMIFVELFYGNLMITFILLLVIVLLSVLLATYFCFRSNNYIYFLQLIPISFSYLLGRAIGIICNIYCLLFPSFLKKWSWFY